MDEHGNDFSCAWDSGYSDCLRVLAGQRNGPCNPYPVRSQAWGLYALGVEAAVRAYSADRRREAGDGSNG